MFCGCARVAPGELDVLGLIELQLERLLSCRRRNASHCASEQSEKLIRQMRVCNLRGTGSDVQLVGGLL